MAAVISVRHGGVSDNLCMLGEQANLVNWLLLEVPQSHCKWETDVRLSARPLADIQCAVDLVGYGGQSLGIATFHLSGYPAFKANVV